MKNILCKYCGYECERVSDRIQDEDIIPRWFQCSICDVSYFALGRLIKIISLHADINDKMYCVDLNYDKNETIIYNFPGDFKPSELVANISGITESITPQNIKEKIKVYLTFI